MRASSLLGRREKNPSLCQEKAPPCFYLCDAATLPFSFHMLDWNSMLDCLHVFPLLQAELLNLLHALWDDDDEGDG